MAVMMQPASTKRPRPDTDAGFNTMFDIFGKADPCFLEDPDTGSADGTEGDADALALAIGLAFDDGTGIPTTEENRCAAESIVSAFGVDRLAEIGLTVATVDDFIPGSSPTMTDAERDIYLDETLTLDDARRFFRGFLAPVDDPSYVTPPDVQAKFDACTL